MPLFNEFLDNFLTEEQRKLYELARNVDELNKAIIDCDYGRAVELLKVIYDVHVNESKIEPKKKKSEPKKKKKTTKKSTSEHASTNDIIDNDPQIEHKDDSEVIDVPAADDPIGPDQSTSKNDNPLTNDELF